VPQQDRLSEAFLWLPDLEGPVYGTKSSAWLLGVREAFMIIGFRFK